MNESKKLHGKKLWGWVVPPRVPSRRRAPDKIAVTRWLRNILEVRGVVLCAGPSYSGRLGSRWSGNSLPRGALQDLPWKKALKNVEKGPPKTTFRRVRKYNIMLFVNKIFNKKIIIYIYIYIYIYITAGSMVGAQPPPTTARDDGSAQHAGGVGPWCSFKGFRVQGLGF